MTELFEIVETTSLEIIDTSPTVENISVSNTTFQNFHKICRFCLGSDNLKPFFDMTYNRASVQSIIYDCCVLQVNPEDCLPYNLCETCITELIRFYRFKTRCIQVSSILQDAYDNRNFTRGSKETIQIYDENEVNWNIKQEEIEDPLSIRSDSTLGDLATIHSENIFADNLIIENEAFQNMVGTCQVNILRDINCDNLSVKNKVIVDPVAICNDNIPEGYTDCKIVKREGDRSTLHCKTTVIVPHSRSVCRKSQNQKLKPKTHTSKTPHKCSVCEKSFTRKPYLKAHSLIHTSEKPYNCIVCNQSFRQKYSLKTHALLHKDEKPHKCSVCKKSFTQKSHLTSHMLRHTGERPHKCSVCKKSFTLKSYLNTHILIHTGERPHNCNVCNQSFRQKSSLKIHMLLHKDEKPHKCSVCKKSFTQKSHLTSHMLHHTGERPHNCSVCKKSFTRKSNLDTHFMSHR